MDVASPEPHPENRADTYPLLMERPETLLSSEHIIDIERTVDASASTSHERTSSGLDASSQDDRPSTAARAPTSQPSTSFSNGSGSRSNSSARRGEGRRRRSPLNSGLWISVEVVLTVSQIIASVVVLSVSRNEHPHAPLFAWIVGYASGCVATLPLLYWRYRNRNQVVEQDSGLARQGSSHINVPAGPFSLSVTRSSEGEDRRGAITSPRGGQNAAINARVKVLVEYFKMGLDCFFAVWFVVGNVWIFGGHSSASEAPNLYRLCIVFLTFSCIGYAMPFILCATICCCLPCIISILGFREDLTQTRGATSESINALPTYKFKLNKSRSSDDGNSGDGGIVGAGTEKERLISGEDAVCCICLAKYSNNDELRELPCSHFFHKDCVDKWLKINASCPLCKIEVGETLVDSGSGSTGQRRVDNRVGNGSAQTVF
ncbi:hypothetical protein Tsubulata_051260 [Turnera subulata]|uniref:RING-type domain-containing protein n=1 Tax=Turnera subulata TaxID=218843 RepID=A0A9Q0FCG4_9ROSI|nr:hypothetical protein Tsubulata_012055 [Turnera subulata]KAJ4834675.1 hypothetical protein Tsubulata_051260 [Turnera subulata]